MTTWVQLHVHDRPLYGMLLLHQPAPRTTKNEKYNHEMKDLRPHPQIVLNFFVLVVCVCLIDHTYVSYSSPVYTYYT